MRGRCYSAFCNFCPFATYDRELSNITVTVTCHTVTTRYWYRVGLSALKRVPKCSLECAARSDGLDRRAHGEQDQHERRCMDQMERKLSFKGEGASSIEGTAEVSQRLRSSSKWRDLWGSENQI